MPTTTAVIGAGAMGKSHLGCLSKVPDARVVALVDPVAQARESVAAEHGVPATYGDLAEMLRREEPEYVVVSSPPLYHAEQTIAAFEAGAHVLCEKPLCMSVAETEAIYDAAERTGRLFTIGFHRRQYARTRAIRRFLEAGKTGPRLSHPRLRGPHHALPVGPLSPQEGVFPGRRDRCQHHTHARRGDFALGATDR